MLALRSFPIYIILIILQLWNASTQTIQEGVDLVTKRNNDLLPHILGSMSAKEENLVVSPFGIFGNLAVLLEGSRGETREQILNFMAITDKDIHGLRIGIKAYCDLFLEHSSNSETAGSFNTLIVPRVLNLRDEFKNLLIDSYCANITSSDSEEGSLTLESHVGVMSHWKFFEKLAVYTFLSHQSLRPFNKKNGLSSLVPMVPLVGIFKTAIWERSRIVALPLETNMVNLMMILPESPKQINALAKSINSNSLVEISEKLYNQELEVFIPQLTILNKNVDYTSLLQTFGVTKAFDKGQTDLSVISTEPHLFVQNIFQNGYFSTSYVALNSVVGISTNWKLHSRSKRDAAKIYFNQPYLFLVLHRDTNLVLLAGKVETPIQVPS